MFKDIEKQVNIPEHCSMPLNTTFPNTSKNDTFINQDILQSLKNDIINSVSIALKELNFLSTNVTLLNFWYNIYHDNQGQEKHWHMPICGEIYPHWSGIYYNKNSSPTIFYKGENPDGHFHKFKGHETSKLKECYWDYFFPTVNDGDILLFPPYLYHSVKSEEKHKSNMRLTFAFNLNCGN